MSKIPSPTRAGQILTFDNSDGGAVWKPTVRVSDIRAIDDRTNGRWHPNLLEIIADVVPEGATDIEVLYDHDTWTYGIRWMLRGQRWAYKIDAIHLDARDWHTTAPKNSRATINRNGRALKVLRARTGN
jgi:hypothetical protein